MAQYCSDGFGGYYNGESLPLGSLSFTDACTQANGTVIELFENNAPTFTGTVIPIDPLQCGTSVEHICTAFNGWFDLFVTFGVYTLPVWAALRLVTRA